VYLATQSQGLLQWESSTQLLSKISLSVVNGDYLANQTLTSVAWSGSPLNELSIGSPLLLYRRRTVGANGYNWYWNFIGNHIDYAPKGLHYHEDTLWIGDNVTVYWREKDGDFFRLGGFVESPGGVVPGLPYSNIQQIAGKGNGMVVLSTARGIMTYHHAQPEGERWEYYASNRHLVNNTVLRLVVDEEGVIYVFHPQGLSILWYEEWTLSKKALHYQSLIEPRHDRFGLVASAILTKYGDLSSFKKAAGETDGLWSSIYLAAQCFRYALTKDEDAHTSGWKTFTGMALLEKVTGIPGLISSTCI